MKVATWNVNSLKIRLPHVLDWLAAETPDVLALQETKTTDDKFPIDDIREAGYACHYAGQKTYNGVALITREPATDPITDIPGLEDASRRILAATVGNLRVLNLYVVNGKAVGTDKYAWKLEWLDKVIDYAHAQIAAHEHVIVLGDFNIAPEDRDVHDPDAWREKILCSTLERERLERLTGGGLVDTFRLFEQEEKSFSWWDYRAAGFRRNLGLRIDLVLATTDLAARCTAARIDKAPRKLERPSDHTPMVAEFDL